MTLTFNVVSNKGLHIFFIYLGVDVTANQEEISDHETFQMEYDTPSKRWYMRTMQDKYFTVQGGGGVQASESKRYEIMYCICRRCVKFF